ncbi:hypothetical protein FM996_06275 [Methylosinus sporium]|uniref:Ribbon-helix-helix protein CopG domain-containing protein n=1 Tax=Methylosinus sporium TaxID=428 RepID=A0A549T2M9_METSR|nr:MULTISPECIES: hypothetical protein [Methylosinus]MBU3890082.1 hypothetical protein [Methylosinus sp. KRF6]TRL36121.1 hypothetical protein FM996_06275 [Methylosinus sporium]
MAVVREKFATQVDRDMLAAIRKIAKEEGRQLQSIVEEALGAYVEKHDKSRPRAHVMSAYESSLERFGSLYEKLAK